MRHACVNKRLGRITPHRQALIKNMIVSLVKHGRIETTEIKAKVAKRYADKMVTLGKKATLHARRLAFAFLRDDEALKKLFAEIAPRFNTRKGGYTRVIKLNNRLGDAAPMALLEWVDYEVALKEPKEKPAKETAAKK